MKLLLILLAALPIAAVADPPGALPWADANDRERAAVMAARAADWRVGPVLYQVLVDRFAPPSSEALAARRDLYAPPRTLHTWDELPVPGPRLPEYGLTAHELAFWGGDLAGLRSRLDYIADLDVDVLYLNPIQDAFTNHKYDARDYFKVSPEYGTRDDVRALADDLRKRDMRLMLDGVFNHMGRTAPRFIEARDNPDSPARDWFIFDESRTGYRCWYNVPNLPELNLENPAVRARLWGDPDSVVQGYLRDGVAGWRLDVSYDIGARYLRELTDAAHTARADCWIIGEAWAYPDHWVRAMDGVMNFHLREIVFAVCDGRFSGRRAGEALAAMLRDTPTEGLLRSWLMLDNHDTTRLRTRFPDEARRRLLTLLQFTLPGSPLIYYGSELGMEGGHDPRNRAPMRWDLHTDDNPTLAWTRSLIALRREHRALRIGDATALATERLFGFLRRTDRAADTCIVLVNPTDQPVTETVAVPAGKLMNANLRDVLSGRLQWFGSGLLTVELPAHGLLLLKPDIPEDGYTPYKRTH